MQSWQTNLLLLSPPPSLVRPPVRPGERGGGVVSKQSINREIIDSLDLEAILLLRVMLSTEFATKRSNNAQTAENERRNGKGQPRCCKVDPVRWRCRCQRGESMTGMHRRITWLEFSLLPGPAGGKFPFPALTPKSYELCEHALLESSGLGRCEQERLENREMKFWQGE